MHNDSLTMSGGALKAMPAEAGQLKLGGHLVVFGDADQTDLSGQWFTKNTYYGAHKGDGVDALFHHSIKIPGLESFSNHIFAPFKVTEDEVGLFAEWVGDAADRYDRAVYKAGVEGKLGLSSGSSPHVVDIAPTGEIKRWLIVEGSFTPTPCEPRARVTSIKSLTEGAIEAEVAAFADYMKLVFDSQEEAETVLYDRIQAQYQEQMRLLQINWCQAQLIDAQMEVLSSIHRLNQVAC